MKKVFLFYMIVYAGLCSAQYTLTMPKVTDESWDHTYYAIRLGFSNYMYSKYPDPVYFQYKSSGQSDMVIQRNMTFRNLCPQNNLDIGYESCMKNRLYTEGNWSMNPWTRDYFTWNLSAGIGYMYSLSKDERLLLCPHMNMSVGSYRYKFLDQHVSNANIMVDGEGLSYINSILFIDRSICATPAVKLIYQCEHVSFYVNVGYCMPLKKKEMISFKQTDAGGLKANCATSDFVMDYEGHSVHENIIEDVHFLQASAGMIVRINDQHHAQKIKPVEW